MGKKTIREFVSKVVYDRGIDPADVILYILDSGEIRAVPFNFVKFGEEGFYYKGNFYPLYKIYAIKDTFTGEYLLHRKSNYSELLGHKEVEINQYPYTLEDVYDPVILIRNTPFILKWLELKIKDDRDFPWLDFFREVETIKLGSYELKIVLDELFKYVGVVFKENDVYGVYRLLPNLYDLSIFSGDLQYQRIVAPRESVEIVDDDIASCFFGKGFLCLDKHFEILYMEKLPFTRKQQLELLGHYVYFLKDTGVVIGIGKIDEKRLLSPRREREILEKLKFNSVFNLEVFYAKDDLSWLTSIHRTLRISDYDQIFVKI